VSPEAARAAPDVIEGEVLREAITAEPVAVDRSLHSFHRSLDVKASQPRVFDIIANVPGYPDFVESCVDARTTWHYGSELHAELTLRQGKSDEHYPMVMHLEPPNRIVMKFVAELPQKLQVEWLVTPIEEDECRLDVTVFYKAEHFAKEIVLRPMLQRAYMQIANAVAAEAERS
jgi:ribosome-associated toxin RatA of RatAB toxin-antitoxin module